MAAPHSVDPAQLVAELASASVSTDVLQAMVTALANALMSAQADQVCGAQYGERSDARTNQRNGYRARDWDTRAGTVELAVPKLRHGSFFPDWLLTHRRRAEQALVTVVATAYLLGVSTRRVEKLAEQLGVKSLSRSQVSEMAAHLDTQVTAFRSRPLDAGPYTFVWVDALTVKVREDGRVVNVHALLATGVNADGHREILGLDVASAEDGAGWLAFLRGLLARGLSGVQLVISDAHPGLVSAIGSALPGAGWQRCRTHWSCKESTWWCRGVLGVIECGEDLCCIGEAGSGGGGCESVLGQDRADLPHDVADGASADLEQFREGVLGAEFALVEHGGKDTFGVSDLLGEHASAGAG
jgi:putative transposase